MKRIRCAAALAVSCSLLLSLCGCRAQKPLETENCALSLTTKEMLEDYDEMWRLIEANYPFQGVAERMSGHTMEDVKADYRQRVKDIARQEDFFPLLKECLAEFDCGCVPTGHLGLMEKADYWREYPSKDIKSPTKQYWMDELNNEASYRFYGVEAAGAPTAMAPGRQGQPMRTNIQGFDNTTALVDEEADVGIIKLNSMWQGVHDAEAFREFFETMQQKGVGNCIIDIRGNPGGSMGYWMDNIVAPNITDTLAVENIALVRGEEAVGYVEKAMAVRPIEQLPHLPGADPADVETMDGFVVSRVEVEPSGDKPLWQGQFYLLVDGKNYSAAEAMANFCKQTGFATLVGAEHTGGDGVGALTPICFALPHSGIVFEFTVLHGLNPDGSSNQEFGTAPDILVEGDARRACLNRIKQEQGER